MYIDTHCHLADEKLKPTQSLVEEYLKANVTTVLTMGCCAKSTIENQKISKEYESVYFASGYHPSDINDFTNENKDIIINLAKDDKCVAIGEIGLDYYWKPFDRDTQIKGFIEQIEIANQLKLPICVHMRDATFDTLQTLKENKPVYGGVLHCFAGSIETCKILLDMGMYIAFGGTVTFKNANKILDVVKYVPNDRILTETDSPYLAPTPYRGTVNSPKNIPIICDFMAKLRGQRLEDLANIIMANAKSLFTKIK